MGLVRQMEWGLDQPQIVYIFGFLMSSSLSQRRDRISKDLENADKRRFVSEEARIHKLSQEKELCEGLDEFLKSFDKALTVFAKKYLPSDAKYMTVLQKLLGASIPYHKRASVISFLRNGEIEKAFDLTNPNE